MPSNDATMDRNTLRDAVRALAARANEFGASVLAWYRKQPLWKRILVALAAAAYVAFVCLTLIYYRQYLHFGVQVATKWRDLTLGRPLLFLLVFIVGFPPLIGFSALSTLSGMIYGVLGGWLVLSTASITGLLASFVVFRYLLQSQAQRLVNSNERFRAFAEILKEESLLWFLMLIRLGPFPYSLLNGALAAIPELHLPTYVLALVLTSPKLFIHVFVGHQLVALDDDLKLSTSKIVDLVSILVAALSAAAVTYFIYTRMQQKLAQYHANGHEAGQGYDELVFGNFPDEENELELDASQFDADNFVIDDEENHERRPDVPADITIGDDLSDVSHDAPKAYRDY